jgi:serine protease Do
MHIRRITICLLVLAVGLAAAACTLPGSPTAPVEPTTVFVVVTATPEATAPQQPAPSATPEPLPTPEPTSSLAVTSLEDVKSAVVQIEAQGSFRDPLFGKQLNVAGRGSGFLIDSSGLAITNNHVATGAAFLKVWVGGETRARNARVLGASECSDLAVIQIEGEGFPFLEWHQGPATPGLDVYVAGFPLGDPEYTLTRGIISKERAAGDTDWASIEYVIEHDAILNPGNSGGPLVTRDGQVVGVNFAANLSTRQSYAIGRTEVQQILGDLIDGRDVTSIGVNGQIVGEGQLAGLWVASVKSGSPADRAGIRSGDMLLEMEGLVLGLNGTMSDYCSILRSHVSTDVLAVMVMRFDTAEMLEGQINGRELTVAWALDDLETPFMNDSGFMTIRDDTDVLEMDVPVSWNDVRSSIWRDSGDGSAIGPRLVAAPDADAFAASYGVPGVAFVASRSLAARHDPDYMLDIYWEDIEAESACLHYEGREPYSDPFYQGSADIYVSCGPNYDTEIVIVAALSEDGLYMTLVLIQFQGEEGLDALSRILDSFWVTRDLP